jgi:hypothetical protein
MIADAQKLNLLLSPKTKNHSVTIIDGKRPEPLEFPGQFMRAKERVEWLSLK